MEDNVNNYHSYIYASVPDSVKVAYHKLCNPDFACFDLGCPYRQTTIISPESGTLEPLGVLDLGGFFLHLGVL